MARKISKSQQRLNEYFATMKEQAFRLYDEPALPGGDAGLFPAAHPALMCLDCGTRLDSELYCPQCEPRINGMLVVADDYNPNEIRYYNGEPVTPYSPLSTLVFDDYEPDEDAPGEAIGGGNGAAVEEDDTANALENEIAASVHQIRQLQEAAEEIAVRMSEAKDRLEALLNVRGSNWSDENGYARLIAGSIRTAYQKDALDALIINDPLHYGWLKQYRKESPLAAHVQVK